MNEAETRAEHIDPALKAAGWGIVEGSRIQREYQITLGRLEGQGNRATPYIADYILVYRNTKLAVLEAKAWDKPYTEGVGKAKIYAEKLAIRFAYATNGQKIYSIDMEKGKEGDIPSYPTPEELWAKTYKADDFWRDRFAAIPYEDRGGSHPSRYYQDIAITRVMEAIASYKDRILLTMATGTGKTFVAFQIVWKLFHSRWNLSEWRKAGEPTHRPRILFLTDRNILADQGYNAFSAFPEEALVRIDPSSIRKKGKVPKNGSIFFTIFQTFMCGPEKDGKPSPYFGEYPSDFFDFIVIDECHRGGANDESTWRSIMEYFKPAVQLGLTATPKRNENVDTYRYFGEPVYVYSLKEGINDGFLTPFRVKQIETTLDEYIYASDDKLVEGEVEEGKVYDENDFNRTIEIVERERYRVKQFMEQIDQREKTIVFCANQAHALLVRDLVNQAKTNPDPNYCHRVTADEGQLGDLHLREFQDNEKLIPTVLTTSQKLSTGVDARNIRNIVLMRPINSIIEFKQIIGRGTRLFEGKDYFTIYDFVKAHEHFNDEEWDGPPLPPSDPQPPRPPKPPKPPEPPGPPQPPPPEPPKKIKIRLADGKERLIDSMMATTFWSPEGKPISAAEFLQNLYGSLPDLFKNEAELRKIWSAPDTRKVFLDRLADKGFGRDTLANIQKLVCAEKSDLFDVLAYVAYTLPPHTREERANQAKLIISTKFNTKQAVFLDFVLSQYIRVGESELDQEKLAPLLKLKYHDSIQDALKDLGTEIKDVFAGFQKYLYEDKTTA
jgi:type I restriction enzyme R subunit